MFERVLPALFVRTLGGTAFTRQRAELLETNVFAHKLLALGFGFVVAVGETLEKMRDVAAGNKDVANELEVSDRGRVDVEDRQALRFPQRDQVQAVEAADNADH